MTGGDRPPPSSPWMLSPPTMNVEAYPRFDGHVRPVGTNGWGSTPEEHGLSGGGLHMTVYIICSQENV